MKDTNGKLESRRRSFEETERLVREYEQSGMSRKEFCAGRGISVHTLDYYRRRHGATRPRGARAGHVPASKDTASLPAFVPVELIEVASAPCLRVELANGRRIVVEPGFDAGLLQRVVEALES
jgi:transposase-like protein